MSDLLISIGGGLAFALFPLFIILLSRTLKHAIDYEISNPKNLSKQIKYVGDKLYQNDRKLILTSFKHFLDIIFSRYFFYSRWFSLGERVGEVY